MIDPNTLALNRQLNQPIFDAVRNLKLPTGGYAISSSGPLGIRGWRKISDADVVVSETVWNDLSKKFAVQPGAVEKIIPHALVEIFHEASFTVIGQRDGSAPDVKKQIAGAEQIEGLPFVSLEHVLYYKAHSDRPKDMVDAELIRENNR